MLGGSCNLYCVVRDNVKSESERFPEWGGVPEK